MNNIAQRQFNENYREQKVLGKHSDVWETVLFAMRVANLHIPAWLFRDRCGMKDVPLKPSLAIDH